MGRSGPIVGRPTEEFGYLNCTISVKICMGTKTSPSILLSEEYVTVILSKMK